MGDYLSYINLALSIIIMILGILLMIKSKKSDNENFGGRDTEELSKN